MSECLFCRIVAGEIPADIVAEGDDWVAFRDVNPQAPTHVLIVPRRHVATLNDLAASDAPLIGALVAAAAGIARDEGVVESGYRLTLEHRTNALDSSARGKFALYWIGIKPGGNFVSWLLLRAIKRRAEATEIAARKELESDVDRSRLGAEGGFDAI